MNFVVLNDEIDMQKAGYDYFHKMELFDQSDRSSIEIGLKRVFGFGDSGVARINKAIEG